ncbi:MAG: glutamine synthetase III [Spirochaetales bacterium]|jgi:glutamine synthetase|nr:glutamine synthetase III [Spirochaetales bacterium]
MAKSPVNFVETPVADLYGSNCFSDVVMRERLPKAIYKEVKKVQTGEIELTPTVADVVAGAIRDWAIERGATHFTHWFQPLTGLTAEKHDSFISPTADGRAIMEFSGKELIQGEPDASSFPSGGLRATFEARGYTAWDVNSPAFLKEDSTGVTLYIPTAFISYHGEALDKKVPLLRSMEALSIQAIRILRALGNTGSKRVVTTLGPEQEYFLVDKELADARLDLVLTGRTLFGARPPKGQEMEDHYFGNIKDRVFGFMRELNTELWKLGIPAKTQHNEVAPNQFELATIFTSSNVATDWNQLVMETMKRIAPRHGLTALLHEKPFAGVNGSGKHNNWSISTDDGINLLEPGSSPHDNAQFLVFLAAVIKAVDVYAPLLRASAANTGNDHRLGANEAPPAIISMFLGDVLSDMLDKLAKGQPVKTGAKTKLEIGVTSMPKLPKDLTDRNRTSPFAFTGNKFEFRMVASSESVATPNTILNTMVSEVLSEFADILEKAKDIPGAIKEIVIQTYKEHKRIIYNGNNYSESWVKEAEKRGLPHIRSTVEALPEFATPGTVKLFAKHGILKKEELESRKVIYLEKYIKQINIEARTMVNMANREIFPAVFSYAGEVGANIGSVKSVSADIDVSAEENLLKEIMENLKNLKEHTKALESLIAEGEDTEGDIYKHALFYKDHIFAKMSGVRYYADKLETLVDKSSWPFPAYEDLLFRL